MKSKLLQISYIRKTVCLSNRCNAYVEKRAKKEQLTYSDALRRIIEEAMSNG